MLSRCLTSFVDKSVLSFRKATKNHMNTVMKKVKVMTTVTRKKVMVTRKKVMVMRKKVMKVTVMKKRFIIIMDVRISR